MFENIVKAPADPILGLADLFKADPRAHKINLGIGVYKNEFGDTPVLNSVKKAEALLLECEKTKNYLGIDGLATFAKATQGLLFGELSGILSDERAVTAQTPGGTGALRVAAEFLANHTAAKRVWISKPTWPNHHNIFKAVGIEVCDYAYYDANNKSLDFEGMLEDLNQAQAGDIVLFHGCCHNPTGIDPTLEQWQQLAEFSRAKGLLPLFDFAYQGFARGLEEDAEGLRAFAQNHRELMVASSYSKNFGLYNERVGACTLIASSKEEAQTAFSQMKSVIRANYSNPPSHGASVVATILNTPALRQEWEAELAGMRGRIKTMRDEFVRLLKEHGATQDFSFIQNQFGMFSFSGLTPEQVSRLKEEFAIYAVSSGRINVAGITEHNIQALCKAIVSVL